MNSKEVAVTAIKDWQFSIHHEQQHGYIFLILTKLLLILYF